MAARACAGGQICVRLHNSEGVVVSLNGDVGLTRGSGGGRFGERALVNRVARATKAAFGELSPNLGDGRDQAAA
jgi:hypothetical protein